MPTKKPSNQKSQPIEKLPAAPKKLNDYAKRYWKEIGEALVKAEALTSLHLRTFETLCRWWGEYMTLVDWCDDNPDEVVFTTEKGYVCEHPKVRQRQTAFDNLQKLWNKFGCTPASLQTLGKHGGGSGPLVNPVLSFAESKYDE